MDKCKHTRKHKYMFTISTFSWQCNYSTIRQQFYYLEALRGSQLYLWVGQRSKATPDHGKKTLCKTENVVPPVVPGLSSNSGTSSSSTPPPQDSSSTSSSPATERNNDRAPGNWRDSPKTQNRNQKRDESRDSDDHLRDLPEWLEEFTENIEDTEVPATAQSSGLRFGTSYESGVQEAQYVCTLPERPKLRSLQGNLDDKGSLQKTH